MKKCIAAAALVLALCLVLSGCEFSLLKSADSLMKPPASSETDQKLIEAFTLAAGESTVFCPPVTGDYKSAVITEDIDGDKSEDALVFYKLKNGQGIVRLNILKKVDGSWKSVSDFSGSGTAVDSVSFTDMDGDGIDEIFTGWRIGTASGKKLSVYRQNSDKLSYQEIMSEPYSLMSCSDADSDGENEVLLVSQASATAGAGNAATLYKFSGGKINSIGSVGLDSNISSYSAIKAEKTAESSPLMFYIDAMKGDSMMITEVVFWSAAFSELTSPFVDSITLANMSTLRYEPIPSMDINNDGAIEIPVQRAVGDELDNTVPEEFYITYWMNVTPEGTSLRTAEVSLINTEAGFIYYLDDSALDDLDISASDKCWVFRMNGKDGSPVDMFSILIMDADSWSDEMSSSYTLLMKNSECIVCAYISPDGAANGITAEYIKEHFSKFEY